MEEKYNQENEILHEIDENAEENTFFDHAYRKTQRKKDSCATGTYTLEEIMHGDSEITLLHGKPAGELKTTTQMKVDEIIYALEHPQAEPVQEPEEDLTFEEMVARNEQILKERSAQPQEPKEPYLSAVINARPGMHTTEIPVICIPEGAICSDDSAFIPVEAVMEE